MKNKQYKFDSLDYSEKKYDWTSENEINYSSLLGDMMDSMYEGLLNYIVKDEHFNDIYNEFKIKERIYLEFEELDDISKIQILIKCYFILNSEKGNLKSEIEKLKIELFKKKEKDELMSNSYIEKIKKESYGYKCERDQLKLQIQDLKILKDRSYKEVEKIHLKYEKLKEKSKSYDKTISSYENDKVELELRYNKDKQELQRQLNDLIKKNENLINEKIQYEELYISTLKVNTEQKDRLDELLIEVKDLKDTLNKINRIDTQHTSLENGITLDKIYMSNVSTENYKYNISKYEPVNNDSNITKKYVNPARLEEIYISNTNSDELHSNPNMYSNINSNIDYNNGTTISYNSNVSYENASEANSYGRIESEVSVTDFDTLRKFKPKYLNQDFYNSNNIKF